MPLLVCRPSRPAGTLLPAVYYIHGGGMIAGTSRMGLTSVLDWAQELNLVAVSVEYRLAPEHPHPAPVDDCYAGLQWLAAHAADLGIDPDRIVVSGTSAGGHRTTTGRPTGRADGPRALGSNRSNRHDDPMNELAGRLIRSDPDAAAAIRVITYFDQLMDGRAGLETIVRGAAMLSGSPARLDDAARRVHIEIDTDGRRREHATPADPTWASTPVILEGTSTLWLERPGPASPIEAVVLERAVVAIRAVLERTRGRAPGVTSPPTIRRRSRC